MIGMNGLRLLSRGAKDVVKAPQNVVEVVFPTKTHLMSKALHDGVGKPVYRKDTIV